MDDLPSVCFLCPPFGEPLVLRRGLLTPMLLPVESHLCDTFCVLVSRPCYVSALTWINREAGGLPKSWNESCVVSVIQSWFMNCFPISLSPSLRSSTWRRLQRRPTGLWSQAPILHTFPSGKTSHVHTITQQHGFLPPKPSLDICLGSTSWLIALPFVSWLSLQRCFCFTLCLCSRYCWALSSSRTFRTVLALPSVWDWFIGLFPCLVWFPPPEASPVFVCVTWNCDAPSVPGTSDTL